MRVNKWQNGETKMCVVCRQSTRRQQSLRVSEIEGVGRVTHPTQPHRTRHRTRDQAYISMHTQSVVLVISCAENLSPESFPPQNGRK